MICDPSVFNIRGNSGIDAQTITVHVAPTYYPYLGVADHQWSAAIALLFSYIILVISYVPMKDNNFITWQEDSGWATQI